MTIKIKIPKVSDTDEPFTIHAYHVNVGDSVKEGDILFDLETDKAVLEVESKDTGVVKELLLEPGSKVKPYETALILE